VRIALAVCAAFLLSSCAWWNEHVVAQGTSAPRGEKRCEKGIACEATVTVKDCNITVSVDTIVVVRDNKDVVITWRLKDSPGVKFAKDGIFFKAESLRAAERQFRRVESKSPEDTFQWRDANTEPGKFKYGVKVIENGKECPPLDPIIINDI
jgi:hypothetical protein